MIYYSHGMEVTVVKPISNEMRRNIIAAKQRNETVEQIKKWLNVSESTISRIWNKFKKTGTYEPIPYTGRRSDIPPEKDDEIRAKIKERPDITANELIDELSLNLTTSGLYRRLAKMGLSYKKRRCIRMDKSERTL